MTYSGIQLTQIDLPLWFVLKAQPKREHIAAAGLRQIEGVETFSPQIRFKKSTRRGPVWFVESLFPGYLFARFRFPELHRQVRASTGITTVVHFGDRVAVVEAGAIEQLSTASGDKQIIVIDPAHSAGDAVRIADGPFRGLEGVITTIQSSHERVKVLLDFLGREVEAEISRGDLLSQVQPRTAGGLAR